MDTRYLSAIGGDAVAALQAHQIAAQSRILVKSSDSPPKLKR
jgi:hypothetical protein